MTPAEVLCRECDYRLDLWEVGRPVLVVSETETQVTFLYHCDRDHWFACGWDKEAIDYGPADRRRLEREMEGWFWERTDRLEMAALRECIERQAAAL